MDNPDTQTNQSPTTNAVEVQKQIDHVIGRIALLNRKIAAYDEFRRQLSEKIEPPAPERQCVEEAEKWWSKDVQPLVDRIRKELAPLQYEIEAHWSGRYTWDSFCGMLDYAKTNYDDWKDSGWANIPTFELRRVQRAIAANEPPYLGASQPELGELTVPPTTQQIIQQLRRLSTDITAWTTGGWADAGVSPVSDLNGLLLPDYKRLAKYLDATYGQLRATLDFLQAYDKLTTYLEEHKAEFVRFGQQEMPLDLLNLVGLLGNEGMTLASILERDLKADRQPGKAPAGSGKPYTFGSDFRSGTWYGILCKFTATQAEVVSILLDAYESGAPDVDAEILVGKDAFTQEKLKAKGKKPSAAKRVRDIFRNNPAWGTVIVPGGTRGTYCLKKP